jgi:hypothetical protein
VVNYTNDDHTEANFDDKLREFIVCHTTDQDRHELVQQLLHPMKPRKEEGVSVQQQKKPHFEMKHSNGPKTNHDKKQGDNFVTEIDSSHEEDSGMATGCFIWMFHC